MPFVIGEKVRQGADGRLYKGDDGLGQTVAIKLISASIGDAAFVLDQAKALRRVKSPHVVEVITTDTFPDPDCPDETLPGIVMEWLDGVTFEDLMAGPLLSDKEAQRIGIGMIDGLSAIHSEKLAHTDLHAANVMIGPRFVKILDIRYYNSLKKQPKPSQDAKLEGDRKSLQMLLNQLFGKSQIPVTAVAAFNNTLATDGSLISIRAAFETAISGSAPGGPQQVDRAIKRLTDKAFVQTPEYATLLADDTPAPVIRPLIESMIQKTMMTAKYYWYLRAVWSRLPVDDRNAILDSLAKAIDESVPDRYYSPHLYMLSAFGEAGWKSLPPITRLRLEKALVNDVSQGRQNAYKGSGGGVLGAWTRVFYAYLADKKPVFDAMCTLLRGNWDTQNYVGEHFMDILDELPSSPEEAEQLLAALTQAYVNNPHIFMSNFKKLSAEWQTDIKGRVQIDKDRSD